MAQPQPSSQEPLDLCSQTSWTMQLPQVPVIELAEVLIVNTFIPSLLIQQLYPLLTGSSLSPKFIVNVSSQEGNFSSANSNLLTEEDYDINSVHPHTNVAKAGLNRLTQSLAGDLARHGTYITSVDPGWVTFMQPHKQKSDKVVGVAPPLSIKDGAARVLDPVFMGLKENMMYNGVL